MWFAACTCRARSPRLRGPRRLVWPPHVQPAPPPSSATPELSHTAPCPPAEQGAPPRSKRTAQIRGRPATTSLPGAAGTGAPARHSGGASRRPVVGWESKRTKTQLRNSAVTQLGSQVQQAWLPHARARMRARTSPAARHRSRGGAGHTVPARSSTPPSHLGLVGAVVGHSQQPAPDGQLGAGRVLRVEVLAASGQLQLRHGQGHGGAGRRVGRRRVHRGQIEEQPAGGV